MAANLETGAHDFAPLAAPTGVERKSPSSMVAAQNKERAIRQEMNGWRTGMTSIPRVTSWVEYDGLPDDTCHREKPSYSTQGRAHVQKVLVER